MSRYLGGSRRPGKPPRTSFKPRFDILEDRVQPSGVATSVAVVAPIDPLPPISIGPPISVSSSVVTVSPQLLQVTRGGPAASFTLVLNSAPTAEVNVTLAAYDPSAATDGTTLTIANPHLAFMPDNWQTPQTVDVSSPAGSTPLPDALVSIFGTTDSGDANFDAQAVPPVCVDVTDGASSQAGLVLSTQSLTVTQGGPSVTYTMALASQPTADVTVAISQVNPVLDPGGPVVPIGVGTPAPADNSNNSEPLTVTPQSLTFTSDNWNTPQTITVSAPPPGQTTLYGSIVFLDDTISSNDQNYSGLQTAPVTVTVESNPAGVVVSTNSLNVTRGGNGDSFTMALATQPTDTVTVTIAQSGGDALQIAPATLMFTTDNWNTPQTVTVGPPTSGAGDQLDTLTLTDSSNDLNYSNGVLPSLSVNVTDPAAAQAGLVLSTQSLTVTAGGPSVTYTIALASQPAADVSVAINQASPVSDPPVPLSGGAAPIGIITGPTLNITPQSLTFTSDNWNVPQTITVSAPAVQIAPWGTVVVLSEAVTSDGDANYNNLAALSVLVHVENNPAGLVLSTNSLNVTRGGNGDSFTMALATQPTDTVTVTIAQSGGDALQLRRRR